jgi:phosphate uptake regulator
MVFKFLGGDASECLERIEAKVQAMLVHDRYEFDLAMSALQGEVIAGEVRQELRSTDKKVNQLQWEIRRDLVVHSSVFGGIDSPTVLVYMSIVKDVERVGDYAKNLLDLARDGADLSKTPDAGEWRTLTAEISRYLADVGAAFENRDESNSRALRIQGDRLMNRFDQRVSALIQHEEVGTQAVARALGYRYLKRIVAHLMNLLSAVLMPVDRLDYFDEDPEDRAGG